MKKHRIEVFADAGYVRKYYNNTTEMNNELEIYNKGWDFLPALRNTGKVFLDFEYKKSVILWDMTEIDFAQIGRLYTRLHNAENRDGKAICHIDCNPRNVLYCPDDQKYYLIDFVDFRWEYAEYDVIHFLLFWAGSLAAADFRKVLNDFLSGYRLQRDISVANWQEQYSQVIRYFDSRRESFGKKEKQSGGDETKNRRKIKTLFPM